MFVEHFDLGVAVVFETFDQDQIAVAKMAKKI